MIASYSWAFFLLQAIHWIDNDCRTFLPLCPDIYFLKKRNSLHQYLGLLIKHKHINNKEFESSNSLPGKIFSRNNFLEKCINHLGTSPKPVQVIPPSPLGEGPGVRPSSQSGVRPNIEEVISFFSKNKYAETEAKKFFNHYQSNGWLVGWKTRSNWPPSARWNRPPLAISNWPPDSGWNWPPEKKDKRTVVFVG